MGCTVDMKNRSLDKLSLASEEFWTNQLLPTLPCRGQISESMDELFNYPNSTFFLRVNFINNEILKAHRQLEANQAPQMGHFVPVNCLTVQGVVSPHPVHRSPTIAVSVFYQAMRRSTQQLSNQLVRPAHADTSKLLLYVDVNSQRSTLFFLTIM